MTILQLRLEGQDGSRSSLPKYLAIADAIGEGIASGGLRAGDRLPAQRDLAYNLGVSLNTVSRAYAEAIERGYLQGEVGRGTYVREMRALPTLVGQARMTRPDEGPIDFSLNLPAPGHNASLLAQTLAELGREGNLASYLDTQAEGDQTRHADLAARWLAGIGLETAGSNIVVTCGAQHGLMVTLLATMRPGDALLTEALTYAPVLAMARHLGLKILPVDCDDGGLQPKALDAACRRAAVKALYCQPTLHTPTTITMRKKRRKKIAAIARKHDILIIEDDVFGFLPPERPAPLACHALERTFFISSASKSMGPGLRVGYLHAPGRHMTALHASVSLSCWMPPPLMAEVASRWIDEGKASELSSFQRSQAFARQALAREILPVGSFAADPHGFHVWLPLPPQWRPDAFRVAAAQRGVKIVTGETFAVNKRTAPSAVRLCLSHEASEGRVIAGLRTIAALLEESDETEASVL